MRIFEAQRVGAQSQNYQESARVTREMSEQASQVRNPDASAMLQGERSS